MKRKPNILKCFQIFLNCGRVILGRLLYVVVQSLSHVHLFTTPWTAARQAPLSFTVSWSLLKFMPILYFTNAFIHTFKYL